MGHPKYSLIVPVFNRAEEVHELMKSLLNQQFKDFELILVEDGSSYPCKHVFENFKDKIPVKYFSKSNSGPGLSRNFGAKHAQGEWCIFLDSDVLIPEEYLNEVHTFLNQNNADAFGGPDRAHQEFTPIQKAINYAMTSFFTTGGIRGGTEKMDKFYPRSFNMGVHKKVIEATGGFSEMRFGEDLDFSLRILGKGFQTALIPKAFVYHKRRTNFKAFFKQVYNSGIARINLYLLYPKSLKAVHALPSAFVLGHLLLLALAILLPAAPLILLLFPITIFLDALRQSQEFRVALLAIPAAYVQLVGYGTGFLHAVWKRLILKKGAFAAFQKKFYN
jgi:glycosyltransferase involved in cell wall biosynthesis